MESITMVKNLIQSSNAMRARLDLYDKETTKLHSDVYQVACSITCIAAIREPEFQGTAATARQT
jgi:hypothetical protein